jgi:hypothetical protein
MTTTSQFLFLAGAEAFLQSQGFHLIPDTYDPMAMPAMHPSAAITMPQ